MPDVCLETARTGHTMAFAPDIPGAYGWGPDRQTALAVLAEDIRWKARWLNSHGLALADRAGRRAARVPGSVIGQDLRSVAALAKSWDFELAALGVAAMNSWFNTEQRVLDSAATLIGDAPCPGCWSWRRMLGPCWSARPPRSRPRSTVAGWTRSVGRGSPTPPWRGNWHAWGPRCGR